MALQSLLLCSDPETLSTLRSILRDLGIGAGVCAGREHANQELARTQFESVILDCGEPCAIEVLADLRANRSNHSALVFLIGPERQHLDPALELGADFVISRPIVLEQAWRCFREARKLMEREQLNRFRAPADLPLRLLLDSSAEVLGSIRNLSLGGLCVQFPQPVPAHVTASVCFRLPGRETELRLDATVTWADDHGRAGLHFGPLPEECRAKLESWIAERLREHEFAFVALAPAGRTLGTKRFPTASLQQDLPEA